MFGCHYKPLISHGILFSLLTNQPYKSAQVTYRPAEQTLNQRPCPPAGTGKPRGSFMHHNARCVPSPPEFLLSGLAQSRNRDFIFGNPGCELWYRDDWPQPDCHIRLGGSSDSDHYILYLGILKGRPNNKEIHFKNSRCELWCRTSGWPVMLASCLLSVIDCSR